MQKPFIVFGSLPSWHFKKPSAGEKLQIPNFLKGE